MSSTRHSIFNSYRRTEEKEIITKATSFKRPNGVFESHTYLRRLPELEDAEAAILPKR